MALFKIFKGNNTAKITNSSATDYITPTDGYAYYDTGSKLFYIDADYDGNGTITRQPINAAHAGIAGNALNGCFYGTCTTAASTKAKIAKLNDSLGFSLQVGTVVIIKFTNASAAATMTLTLQDNNNKVIGAAKNLELYGTTPMSSGTTTNGWQAGAVVPFIYDGTNWIRFFWENSTYYYTSAYCTTAAGTAAKVGASSGVQTLTGSKYFQIWIQNTNTAASALTLNMNSLGAKKIYLNGEPTSSTNYNLLRGCYLVYYDAEGDSGNGCYHFRTDNKIPGNLSGNAATATKATQDSDGNDINTTYLKKTNGITNVSFDSATRKLQKIINGTTSDITTLAIVPGSGDYSAIGGEFGTSAPVASGASSFAYGNKTTASGNGAVAFGNITTASGNLSMAVGGNTVASGPTSFAGGTKMSGTDYGTTAGGIASFAYGNSVKAEGGASQAFGQRTIASANMSTAFGNYTIAAGRTSMSIGQYNIEDTDTTTYASYGTNARKYLFIIGNGTADDARSNAFTVDWAGNINAQTSLNIANSVSMIYDSTNQALNFVFA